MSYILDYHHFLHGYDPFHAPHQLQGPLTIKTYNPNNNSPNKNNSSTITNEGRITSSHAFLKSAGTSVRIEEEYNQNVLAAKERYLASHPNTASAGSNTSMNNTLSSSITTTTGNISKGIIFFYVYILYILYILYIIYMYICMISNVYTLL